MSKTNCGGTVVKTWPGYFLRDDEEIRKNANIEPNIAFSLFREEPYGRIIVLAPLDEEFSWVLEEAERQIDLDRKRQ